MKFRENVHVHFIKTNKFKDIGIHIRFLSELEPFQATCRSLLGLMLIDRCTAYDTKQKMSSHLDYLYGTTLQAQTLGYGKAQVLEVRSRLINPNYLKGQATLLENVFQFLNEVIFNPYLNEDVLEECKSILKAKIERMHDEPSDYVISKGLKTAGEGLPLAISALGEVEHICNVTLDDIRKCYLKLISEDQIDIIICGDIDESKTIQYIQQYLPFKDRNGKIETFYLAKNDKNESYQIEYRNVPQASVMMTYFTNTAITDENYNKLKVANAILGQYSTSFLFQEVREKNSLCYSIFSNLISYDGVLGITTGVEMENLDKAIALIKEQVEKVKSGNFTDEHLNVSKTMIINSLKASKDAMNSLIALKYQNVLCGRNRTIETIIEEIENVTKEDVVAAIANCECKGIFVLTGKDS